MKKASGNTIRLGIFVSLGFALFIAAIYFIGQRQHLFNETFHVSGTFSDISGLQVGNNVRFSGINVGVVDDIQQISDTTVMVDMQINEDTRAFIKKDAKALIGSDGLMGNKIVLILPGTPTNKVISDNDVIETVRHVSMDDILRKVQVTSDNVATITGDLSAIIGNIRNGKGTVGKFFMDSVLANDVSQAMVNIKQGTGGFKKNMDAASQSFLLRGHLKDKNKEKEKEKQEKQKELEKEKEKEKEKSEEKADEKEKDKTE